MTYHLLDHCNARNAAELARCATIGPECAKALGTLEWAPTSEYLQTMACHRYYPTPLGYGGKIRCGAVMDADEYDVREFGTAALSRNNYNVCRPFDEAHATRDELDREWNRLRWCDSLTDEHGLPITKPGEIGALNDPLGPRPFKATIPKRLNVWIQFATPPNHGHGAKCGCGVNRLLPENATIRMDNPKFESVADAYGQSFVRAATGPRCMVVIPRCAPFLLQPDANGKFVTRDADGRVFAANWPDDDCPHCAGTGRIICDDERAGRVSPSHAAGGYAEWQRPSSVVGHVASQVPPELAGIFATDGDPATTERRR